MPQKTYAHSLVSSRQSVRIFNHCYSGKKSIISGYKCLLNNTEKENNENNEIKEKKEIKENNENMFPWSGGQINGFFMWQGNFVGSSPTTQYYFTSVTGSQISYQTPNYLTSSSGTFTYSNLPQPNSDTNAIFLFTGYSNAATALNNLKNYTTNTNMYNDALSYFGGSFSGKLIGLCLGGGYSVTGSWNTGNQGAIYSIYQAVTNSGISFSYTESGTGNTLTGVGTGILNNSFNSLLFDIETWDGSSGSTANDFLNLFSYIKENKNSTFYSFECIIIASIAHSCSNYNGTGQKVCSGLLSDPIGVIDYFCPQLYTQNVGTMNEYCANYNILWTTPTYPDPPASFVSCLSKNKNFQTYGLSMLLPAVNNLSLTASGGSNNNNPPNLYWYQYTGNSSNPAQASASGALTIPYNIDNGAQPFFQAIFNTANNVNIGGGIAWVNGSL
jgi:hypothetical protein